MKHTEMPEPTLAARMRKCADEIGFAYGANPDYYKPFRFIMKDVADKLIAMANNFEAHDDAPPTGEYAKDL